MIPEDVIRRLTGLTTPWKEVPSVPAAERALAEEMMEFLAARRVMYLPAALETPHHCVSSVFVISDTLTGFSRQVAPDSALHATLRGMRAACLKFLSAVQADRGRKLEYPVLPGDHGIWAFATALGELRGVMGIHVAHVAARYSLDVSDDLATILPDRDTSGPL